MKKLKVIIAISVSVLVIASCGPKPVPQCTQTCNNGGVVNAGCGCDCPSGFTGTNCQTVVNNSNSSNTLTTLNVSINHDNYYILCPQRETGDNEFGGNIRMDGSVRLTLEANNTKIYAVVNVTYIESLGGDTQANIDGQSSDNRILLYTAPSGKVINSINTDTYKSFYWYPVQNQLGTGTLTYVNSFIYKIEMIGDTTGDDLPCDGSTGRSRFKIWFDDFSVTIGNQ